MNNYIPPPFNNTLNYLTTKMGYTIIRHDWTDDRMKRHYGAHLIRDGREVYAKMKDLGADDSDDYNSRGGLDRTVWAYNIIKMMLLYPELPCPDFPVDTPTMVDAPQKLNLCGDVGWFVTEYNPSGAYVDTRHLPVCGDISSAVGKKFTEACHVAAKTWKALQTITPDHLLVFGLPLLPHFVPYQALGLWGIGPILAKKEAHSPQFWNDLLSNWTSKRLIKMKRSNFYPRLCFGPDAFELPNFLSPPSKGGLPQITDLESFFWYPRGSMIAKCFIRLWVNNGRPDLAVRFLRILFEHIDEKEQGTIAKEIQKSLHRKIRSGYWFDRIRRSYLLKRNNEWRQHLKATLRFRKLYYLLDEKRSPEDFLLTN